MHRLDTLQRLLTHLYAAPGTDDEWMPFLKALNECIQGRGTHFMSVSSDHRHASVSMSTSATPEALADYHAHWGAFDPWTVSSGLFAVRPKTVVLGEELVTLSEFRRTGYYHDFARRYDFVQATIGMIENNRGRISVVSVNRSERQRPFANEEARLLGALMPHLQRALQLHRRLLGTEIRSAQLGEAIDSLTHGVVLIAAGGQIVMANRAANDIIGRRDGLTFDEGELRASDRAADGRLRALIRDVAKTSTGEGVGAGGTLLLGRASGRRPLLVIVSPVSPPALRESLSGVDTAVAMVVISDPDQGGFIDEVQLCRLFRLTAAEARLTRLVAEGVPLTAAAARLGITCGTARTRLRGIFEKTGTHSQMQLTVTVLRSARSWTGL